MAYGIIICTKCREQAQIIGLGSSKTTRCQRCNATLMTRKLRIFFSSDDLNETISVRTQVQAQIADTGKYTPRAEENGASQHQVFGAEIDEKAACMIDNRKVQKKKKADELILGILISNEGKMSTEELKKAALSQDVDDKRFEDVLKKLLQAGEIYSPSKGSIKIV